MTDERSLFPWMTDEEFARLDALRDTLAGPRRPLTMVGAVRLCLERASLSANHGPWPRPSENEMSLLGLRVVISDALPGDTFALVTPATVDQPGQVVVEGTRQEFEVTADGAALLPPGTEEGGPADERSDDGPPIDVEPSAEEPAPADGRPKRKRKES